jgi:hypothetical protein
MIEQSTSLIQRDADQAFLWSPDEIPAEVLEVESTEGHYSGDRLMSQRPAVYRAIVYLLGCGVPRRTISDKLRVHHKTVAAVAARESESIAAQKREVAAMARHGQAMVLDSLLEDIASGAKISAKDKAIVLGILTDTADKLDPGTVYERVDHHGSTPGHEEYQEFLDQLSDAERSALTKMGRAAEKRVAKEQAARPVIGEVGAPGCMGSTVYDVEDSE